MAEEAAQQLRVFVSHSSQDDAFCRAIVQVLRDAGADVWYDEHNLGSGQLKDVILRELGSRPIFVVILSKAAIASRWVKREADWAEELGERDPSRVFLPVTASPITRNDFGTENGWLAFYGYKRIEAAGFAPYPVGEASTRLLRALALTPAEEALTSPAQEQLDDLLTRGKALQAQGKHTEALPLLERATQHAPGSFDAWANLGSIFGQLARYQEALGAYDRALAIDDQQASVWNNKGRSLHELRRYEEALVAFERALALDNLSATRWTNRGASLMALMRYDDALAAFDRALEIDSQDATAWNNKGNVLWRLARFREAVSAYDQAIALDPTYAAAWSNKSGALGALGWTTEADEAALRARELRREHHPR